METGEMAEHDQSEVRQHTNTWQYKFPSAGSSELN